MVLPVMYGAQGNLARSSPWTSREDIVRLDQFVSLLMRLTLVPWLVKVVSVIFFTVKLL
jgi:hypothetical protein